MHGRWWRQREGLTLRNAPACRTMSSAERRAPSAERRAPSAERRAPSAERRAPSAERRAPSAERRAPRRRNCASRARATARHRLTPARPAGATVPLLIHMPYPPPAARRVLRACAARGTASYAPPGRWPPRRCSRFPARSPCRPRSRHRTSPNRRGRTFLTVPRPPVAWQSVGR